MIAYYNITYLCNENCVFCAANHGLINRDHSLSFQEFRSSLDENNIKSGDKIILNGGEPTLNADFLQIIDECNKREINIELFTNGILLSDDVFCQRVMRCPSIKIKIPLYGVEKEHNLLTNMNGFEDTIRGINNILKNKKNDQMLEIKLLLSSITVNNNLNVIEYLYKMGILYEIKLSLNPLIISDKVKLNYDLFVDSFENLIEKSDGMFKRLEELNKRIDLSLIPMCKWPKSYIEKMEKGIFLKKKNNYSAYVDKQNCKKEKIMQNHNYLKECENCTLRNACCGFSKSYLENEKVIVRAFS